ncbi:hypothetical protein OAG24_00200 [bacterium]|nr:hypothetical protein [bacterium]
MCFSIESSLSAWLVSVVASVILINKGTKNNDYFTREWLPAFILVFSTIQLLEAGIWASFDNKNLTKLIFLGLLAQPLTQSYMGSKDPNITSEVHAQILKVMTFVFSGVMIWGIWKSMTSSFSSHVGNNGRLVWNVDGSSLSNSFPGILYLIGIVLPLLFVKPIERSLPLIMVGIATFIFSWYQTRDSVSGKSEGFGSYWCFSAIAFSLTALFV